MLKWILILFGGVVLLLIAFMVVFGFMVWNHERGYPKSILSDEAKDICVVNKDAFVFIKTDRATLREEMEKLLPLPDGVDHFYSDYTPGSILLADGSDIQDLTGAIEVPAGTRFIVRDGFQRRTLNESSYFYWLEPEDISLDSSYFYRPLAMTTRDGETYFYSDEEMSQFPEDTFVRACDEDG